MTQSLQFLSMPSGVKRFLATEALYGLSIGMFMLILNLHFIEMGITGKQIGLIVSIGILVLGVFAIPVSILAKKTGRKKLLVIGITFVATGCTIFAFGGSFAAFLIAQLVVSIGFTLVETTEIQLLFHYSKSRRQETQAYSFVFAVFTAFTGVGTLLSGYLPNVIDVSGKGYQNTLLVASLLFIILACLRGFFLPAEKRGEENREKQHSFKPKQKVSFEMKKKLILFSIFALMTGAAFASLQPYLNLFVKFRLDFSNEAVSIVLAIHGFALFIGSVFAPSLIERFGVKKTFFYIYLLNILFCLVLFINVPPYFFSVLLFVRGGMFTMLTNLVDSLCMSSFKDEERDLYAGMRAVFRSVGSALAAFIIGGIISAKNYTLPFLITGIILFLGYVYFVIVIRPRLLETDEDASLNREENLSLES